jgi:hypothetical protein
VLAAALVAGSAAAHGGAPRLLLEPERANPGSVVTVRGEDLGSDEPITFRVTGLDGSVDVGGMTADPEGHLVVALKVPVEMEEGVYALEAYQMSGLKVATSTVFVAGPPILEGEGGPGGKDEDDLLLIALPAGWQQSLSSPAITAVPVTSAGSRDTLAAGATELGLLFAIGVVLLAAAVAGAVLVSRVRSGRAHRQAEARPGRT